MATVKLDPAKGIQIPNLTTTERNAISSPETGAIIWNTTTSEINQYNGSAWEITYTDTSVAGITSAADATAITIDSNEQVTMGGTTLYAGQGNTATGQHFENTGTGYLSRTGGYALGLNRNTSDGTIINFARQGSSVGSIDASTSGISIKLGGTAAANALDDYEEGTFTPTVANGTIGAAAGEYTKIGNVCTLTFTLKDFTDKSTNAYITIRSLPFTQDGTATVGTVIAYQPGQSNPLNLIRGADGNEFHMYHMINASSWTVQKHNTLGSDPHFYCVATYKTT